MPIGASDGAHFEDGFAYTTGDDANRMPVGSPTEPAGALKSSGGSSPTGNVTSPQATSQTPDRGALDKLLGIGGPRYQLWPERLVRSALTEPHDAMQGQSEDEMIQRAGDLASFAVGGSMPAALALKAEQGTLGSFAGIRSLANHPEAASKYVDLGKAQVFESEGMHPDDVYAKTGFFRGAEGKWRYEIDDSKSHFNPGWADEPDVYKGKNGGAVAALPRVLDHPELFAAYPDLKKSLVFVDPKVRGAYFNGLDIYMNPEYAKDQGILMHEVQHAIQGHEGFAEGGSPDYRLRFDADVSKVKQHFAANPPTDPETAEHLNKILSTYEKYKQAGKEKAAFNYLRLAGETEARNTDTRLLLNEKERRQILPRSTEDIPRSAQHVSDVPLSASAYGYGTSAPPAMDERFRSYNPKWPVNDNTKTLNEHEQFIKDYDELHNLGESLGVPSKLGHRIWSELDTQKYNKAGRAFAKKHGQTWEDIPYNPK